MSHHGIFLKVISGGFRNLACSSYDAIIICSELDIILLGFIIINFMISLSTLFLYILNMISFGNEVDVEQSLLSNIMYPFIIVLCYKSQKKAGDIIGKGLSL